MTSRERILTAFSHERPDRTPAVLAARPEVNRDLMRHFGTDSMEKVHRILGTDGWSRIGVGIDFSDFQKRTNGTLEGDCPYAGSQYVFHDANTFEDEWGVVRRKGRDGKYVQWITGPLAEADDPDEYDFPGRDRLIPDPDMPEKVRRLKEQDTVVNAGVPTPFKTAWELRGLENLLADYIANT